MRHLILPTIALVMTVFSLTVKAQDTLSRPFEVISGDCKCPEFEFVNGAYELKDIHQSDNDLEIRFSQQQPGGFLSTVVFTKKEGKLAANYYHKRLEQFRSGRPDSERNNLKWEKYSYKKFLLSEKADSVLLELLHNNILGLPNYNELYKGKGLLNAFYVTYKVNNHIRSYYFANTKALIAEFPDVKEYGQYESIREIIASLIRPYRKQSLSSYN
ncbi:hypothetical protein [Pedobacter foliorum]|uniref:hypothetical protein n=1 Tax=Pedobacter foliorum TaxID=2739058 RepID=UPI001563C3D1|nr:hypothetical protein [Pedobacter foliorum]NRF37217.1 hypothetical protein [Pedobacter foliorum]